MLVDDSFLSKEFNYSGSPIKLKKMKYNTNLRIIQNLDILKKYNQKNKQIYKVKAYNTAIENIKKLPINSGNIKMSILLKSSLSKLARQVDIIIIPKKYYFASLLYFTGNKFFNERIRWMFKKAGYTLNATNC